MNATVMKVIMESWKFCENKLVIGGWTVWNLEETRKVKEYSPHWPNMADNLGRIRICFQKFEFWLWNAG